MKRLYLDSNVLISLLKEEVNGNFRSLFAEATAFFEFTCKNEIVLIISNVSLSEIKKTIALNEKSVFEFLNSMKIKIEIINMIEEDLIKGKNIEKQFGIHQSDASQTAMALRAKADCIVSFNLKDFEKVKKLIPVKEPKEFT